MIYQLALLGARHIRRDTRVGPQCTCGNPHWTRRHSIGQTMVDAVREAIYRLTR